jgi:glycosyltransferase involved in cell wall biosynthesis
MHILLLRHYSLVEGHSMSAFADLIATGLRGRGHHVSVLTAPMLFGGLFSRAQLVSKWLGYVDQFLIFPPMLWLWARLLPPGSLCVLADQALGPWLPWLAGRPDVVHCHDLLALEGSFGLQPYHRISWSGRQYQRLIMRGFQKGHCFLSVSAATKSALETHLVNSPLLSAVLHNPLSPNFRQLPPGQVTSALRTGLPGIEGHSFVFHIGRTWYKNRLGVLAIWQQLLNVRPFLHLVLLGPPDSEMQSWLQHRPCLAEFIHILPSASNELVVALYNRAEALLFPSHAEGFGWPVLEALACGCPVITTDRPPMTEVGGDAVTTIPPAPPPSQPLDLWAREAALQVQMVLDRSPAEQERIRQLGFAQASRFQLESWLDQLEAFYKQALSLQLNRPWAL